MCSVTTEDRKDGIEASRQDHTRVKRIAFLGFGEAGPVFAKALRTGTGAEITAFDRLTEDPARAGVIMRRAVEAGATLCASVEETVRHAGLVISVVTASSALATARAAAPSLNAEQIYLDLNSVSPTTKRSICDVIAKTGAGFVEGVAMDKVTSRGASVPVLLCGTGAEACAATFNAAGLQATSLGSTLGAASAAKLCRSIVTKGLEALLTEAMHASAVAGVRDAVLSSLAATYPQLDWSSLSDYYAQRMREHGHRRAAELREAAAMLEDLGLSPELCAAVARSQEREAQK